MGIVFPTIPLSVMGIATEGREADELSSMILMDYFGVGVGAGLAGVWVALADAGTLTLEAGLAGAFGVGIVAAIVLALIAGRLPDARSARQTVAPQARDGQESPVRPTGMASSS